MLVVSENVDNSNFGHSVYNLKPSTMSFFRSEAFLLKDKLTKKISQILNSEIFKTAFSEISQLLYFQCLTIMICPLSTCLCLLSLGQS